MIYNRPVSDFRSIAEEAAYIRERAAGKHVHLSCDEADHLKDLLSGLVKLAIDSHQDGEMQDGEMDVLFLNQEILRKLR